MRMNLCGWHALLECECKHLYESGDDDDYKELNWEAFENIEAKISLPSSLTWPADASHGCHSSLHCSAACQRIRVSHQDGDKTEITGHSLNTYVSSIHHLAYLAYWTGHPSILSYIRMSLQTKIFGELVHLHVFLPLWSTPLSCKTYGK